MLIHCQITLAHLVPFLEENVLLITTLPLIIVISNNKRNTSRIKGFSTTSNNTDDQKYLCNEEEIFEIDSEISTSDNVGGNSQKSKKFFI